MSENKKFVLDVFENALEQDEISRKAMEDVIKERTPSVEEREPSWNKKVSKMSLVKEYLKENANYTENNNVYNVGIKDRKELGNLISLLKEDNIQYSVKRSLQENQRYNVTFTLLNEAVEKTVKFSVPDEVRFYSTIIPLLKQYNFRAQSPRKTQGYIEFEVKGDSDKEENWKEFTKAIEDINKRVNVTVTPKREALEDEVEVKEVEDEVVDTKEEDKLTLEQVILNHFIFKDGEDGKVIICNGVDDDASCVAFIPTEEEREVIKPFIAVEVEKAPEETVVEVEDKVEEKCEECNETLKESIDVSVEDNGEVNIDTDERVEVETDTAKVTIEQKHADFADDDIGVDDDDHMFDFAYDDVVIDDTDEVDFSDVDEVEVEDEEEIEEGKEKLDELFDSPSLLSGNSLSIDFGSSGGEMASAAASIAPLLIGADDDSEKKTQGKEDDKEVLCEETKELTPELADDLARVDRDIGISPMIEELEKLGYDCSTFWKESKDIEWDDDQGWIDARDRLLVKLGIKEIMDAAYDRVWDAYDDINEFEDSYQEGYEIDFARDEDNSSLVENFEDDVEKTGIIVNFNDID